MSLIQKQANMKKRHSGAVHEVALHKRECMSRREPEWIGTKTKRQLVREGLSTRARELKAEIVRFGERRREQSERRYAVEIRTVSPEELAALDQPGSVFRLQ
jgi:hypothetical protein